MKTIKLSSVIRNYIRENILIRSGEIKNKFINSEGEYETLSAIPGHSANLDYISVVPGEKLFFTKINDDLSDNIFRFAFFAKDGTLIERQIKAENYFEITVPSSAVKLRVSYPDNSNPRIERLLSSV